MDTGEGRFVLLEDADQHPAKKQFLEDKYPNHGGWFKEGQTILVNGSLFKIKRVKPTELVLRLVKRATLPEDKKALMDEQVQKVRNAIRTLEVPAGEPDRKPQDS
jgi:hypothetical protein